MSLESVLRDVESARSQLKHAEADSSGWSDSQRRSFDSQRMSKLHDAGRDLQVALSRASDRYREAMQLLGEQR